MYSLNSYKNSNEEQELKTNTFYVQINTYYSVVLFHPFDVDL